MGCDGLKYNTMAEAFRRKGAKVWIGWDGLVSTPHTDHATTRLLQHLAVENTVNDAVGNTMNEVGPEERYFQDQGYNSTLKYYPIAAGGYKIEHTLGISDIDLIETKYGFSEKTKETKLNQPNKHLFIAQFLKHQNHHWLRLHTFKYLLSSANNIYILHAQHNKTIERRKEGISL